MNTPDSRRVRDLVYETLASEGRAPSVAELARRTRSTTEATQKILHELAEAHALVLTADGDAVRMAHPFTAAPMAFVVTPLDGHDDRRWWGGCAWDSFGISAALDLDVRIDTACPQCGTPIAYQAGPRLPPPAELAVRFPRPAGEWWDDVVATCTMIRTFCDRGHAERWTADNAPGGGYIAEAATVWRLAGPWYGDRLDSEFQPHSREHNQRLLDECGLTGPFWRLP
ncbi:alkylmercury lyase family protein [Actinomadura sp. NEAU-AAG7]|uniref:alkylmercury lyase family protein n=1 Tax=Actinomadura sp. NEAU-AAG7 TaxID=2839640 RepID=UPI001BE4A561|nr:alkylmercury lyase family protein [Actinomadura sp. NEAU-AAG7]MBT2208056.1 alkylmercury lyase family protein [Actinomadura sp. NEAU-AAG7]